MRTLFISPSSPFPPTSGDRQRTDLVYQAIKCVSEIDFFLYRDIANLADGTMDKLKQDYPLAGHMPPPHRGSIGASRIIRPLAPKIVDRLAHNFGSSKLELSPIKCVQQRLSEVLERGSYDLVVSRYLRPAVAAAPWNRLPTIVDVDDYPPQVYAQRLRKEKLNVIERLIIQRHLKNQRRYLPALLRQASHLWVPNALDQKLIEHPSISVLPNIPYQPTPSSQPVCEPATQPQRMTMIGSLDYQVNIDGLKFFLAEVWPMIRQARADAELQIVGRGLAKDLRTYWSSVPGVTVAGYVDNIRMAYERCSFCIVPVFTGGGTKIKVLESLNHSRTCVVSGHALRGFEHVLRHEDSLLVANDAQQMAEACLRLISDTDFRDEIAVRGCRLVKEHFSFQGFAREVEQTIERVTNPC